MRIGQLMTMTRLTVPEVAALPVYSHASVAGNHVYVAGTLGTKPGVDGVVAGGMASQTRQALTNLAKIVTAAGGTLADIAKVNVTSPT